MKRITPTRIGLAALCLLSIPASSLAGPKGIWMLTDGDNATDALIIGNSVTTYSQGPSSTLQYAIQWDGVNGWFETVGRDQNDWGGVYSPYHQLLGYYGNYTSLQGQHLDGTLDTGLNRSFASDYSTGDVVEYGDQFFNGPSSSIYNTGGVDTLWSITYAKSNGHLFLGGNGVITEITDGGTFVNSFNTAGGRVRSLAYDSLDNSLWYLTDDGSTAVQLDLAGNILERDVVNLGGNYWGGEIAPVPEPATLSVMGVGLLALLRRRRAR